MGLFLRQNETRSQLQTKIAADLSERINKRTLDSANAPKTQPAILDDQQQTSKFAWVWIVLGIVVAIAVIIALTR